MLCQDHIWSDWLSGLPCTPPNHRTRTTDCDKMSSDDSELDEEIARLVLENGREKIINDVNVWFVAPFTLNADLVGDKFIKQLQASSEEGLSNQQLMSRLLDRVVLRSGWFARFINVLAECHRYRPLAVELNDREYFSKPLVPT